MKKFTLIAGLTAMLTVASSCESGFDQLNTNPTAATSLNPVFTFNNALLNSTYPNGALIWEMPIVQQVFSPNSGVLAGANFNVDNTFSNFQNWQRYYRDVIRYLVDIINTTKADPNRSNLYHMTRIWKAYSFMVMTDTYGDVPYFEAGQGFLAGNTLPKYDKQEAIYADILKELNEASAALDASKTREVGEVLYGGDITKWKRLGYSLLLRAGMRLTKVNATLAQSTVAQAVAGGVMQSNADNAAIRNDANYQNPIGVILNSTEANNFYLTKTFVDYLKSTNDPRLASIAARYVGAKTGSEQTPARINRDPAVQIGMPLGYDNGTVGAQATRDGLASFYDYSQLDRTRLAKLTAPCFIVTYAQTQLLLAEAAQRGWVTASPAATYYANGVRAHMEQLAEYDATAAVPAAAVTTYLAANPYAAARGLEQINTQYWLASLLNGPEAWANFRRSGFPALPPNPFPGKGIKGNFIRRLTYPDSEILVNNQNLQAALTAQGASSNNNDTPVWWDK